MENEAKSVTGTKETLIFWRKKGRMTVGKLDSHENLGDDVMK